MLFPDSAQRCSPFLCWILAGLVALLPICVATAAEGPCGLPPTFADSATYTQTIHVDPAGSDSTGDGSELNPYATLVKAASVASPGTIIVVHEGTYSTGQYISNLQGTETHPILITSAEGEDPPQFDRNYSGNEAIKLTDPRYVIMENLIIRRALQNGLNIDDGGSYGTPAEHIVLSNLTIDGVGSGGNNDSIKLSGVNYIRIIGCVIRNTNAGSGIDMVGCHYSEIVFSEFHDGGSNAMQTKGGTEDILVYGNLFVNAGSRAIQMGGSTGAAYFRPIDAPFEGKNIRAIANVIIGSQASIAFASAIDCLAANNTIYTPTTWIMRILNENTSKLPPQNGRFFDNIVVFNHSQVTTFVNIGSNTMPETFTFSNNLWYALDYPGFSGPSLPTPETDPIIQQDPQFVDAPSWDFHLLPTSPAGGAGVDVAEVSGDRDAECYLSPPTIGAYEIGFAPGDLDEDCDVDLDDVDLFLTHMLGPAAATTDEAADLDGDGDADLGDFAVLAENFTGPGAGCG